MIQSMSRKGNCWDNAPMESCFGTIKTELVHQACYKTRDAARHDLFAYIEGYYNRMQPLVGLQDGNRGHDGGNRDETCAVAPDSGEQQALRPHRRVSHPRGSAGQGCVAGSTPD